MFYVLSLLWGLSVWELYVNFRQFSLVFFSDYDNLLPIFKEEMSLDRFNQAKTSHLLKLSSNIAKIVINSLITTISLKYGLLAKFWYVLNAILPFNINGYLLRSIIWLFFVNCTNRIINYPFALFDQVYLKNDGRQKNIQDVTITYMVDLLNHQAFQCFKYTMISLLNSSSNNNRIFIFMIWILGYLMFLIAKSTFGSFFSKKYQVTDKNRLTDGFAYLAKKVGFPKKTFYVINSGIVNGKIVCISGFLGFEQVLIEEEALVSLKDGELLSVLVHRLGIWLNEKVIQELFLKEICYVFTLTVLFATFEDAILDLNFGFSHQGPASVCLRFDLIDWYFLKPVDFFSNFCCKTICRKHTLKADDFARFVRCDKKLMKTVIKTNVDNFEEFVADNLYCEWYRDEPTITERFLRLGETNKMKSSESKIH